MPALRQDFAPWAGWITATLAAGLNHQTLADLVYFDCRYGHAGNAVVLGLLCLVIAWAGGLISWRARSASEGLPEANPRYFIALIGVMLPALYSLMILMQVMSGLIVPGCYR
jgi:hypothetical protein